jgi:hypothetical protein
MKPLFIRSIIGILWFLTGCTDHVGPTDFKLRYNLNGFNADTLHLNESKELFALRIDSIFKKCASRSFSPDGSPSDSTIVAALDLFYSETFVRIYEQAGYYLNNAVAYISDTSLKREKRCVAMFTMLEHDFVNNINFFYACAYLREQGLVDENMLMYCSLVPDEFTNVEIIKYYKNPIVQKVLTVIRDNPKTSGEPKEIIYSVLSGEAYRSRKDYFDMEARALNPPWWEKFLKI